MMKKPRLLSHHEPFSRHLSSQHGEAYFRLHHFLPPLLRLGIAVFSRSAVPKVELCIG